MAHPLYQESVQKSIIRELRTYCTNRTMQNPAFLPVFCPSGTFGLGKKVKAGRQEHCQGEQREDCSDDGYDVSSVNPRLDGADDSFLHLYHSHSLYPAEPRVGDRKEVPVTWSKRESSAGSGLICTNLIQHPWGSDLTPLKCPYRLATNAAERRGDQGELYRASWSGLFSRSQRPRIPLESITGGL